VKIQFSSNLIHAPYASLLFFPNAELRAFPPPIFKLTLIQVLSFFTALMGSCHLRVRFVSIRLRLFSPEFLGRFFSFSSSYSPPMRNWSSTLFSRLRMLQYGFRVPSAFCHLLNQKRGCWRFRVPYLCL